MAKLLERKRPAGLGDMVDALLEPIADLPTNDPRVQVEQHLGGRADLRVLERLQQDVTGVDKTRLARPLQHRNDIAHGMPIALSRLGADAVRRVLTLGSEAVLPALVAIPRI
jgi:hypothetical protein